MCLQYLEGNPNYVLLVSLEKDKDSEQYWQSFGYLSCDLLGFMS